MLCTVYKSSVKPDTYLYIERREDFSRVPEKLMETFGTPIFVMMVNLADHAKLALADKQKVMTNLQAQGFYLQLPPPEQDLLKQHLADMKAKQASGDENKE